MIAHHFITLTQPWATLMAIGAKTIETRGWYTRFRGPIAIHAAMGYPKACQALCWEEPFASVLRAAGETMLPRGHILAVCTLDDCKPTDYLRLRITSMERSFGDYGDGRYGFLTSGLRRLKTPVPFKGALGIRPIRGEPITEDMLA